MPRVASYDQIEIMGRALHAAGVRHQVIADNITNVNTPGFRRSEVQFERILADALDGRGPMDLRRTDPRHLSAKGRATLEEATPRIVVEADTYARNDRSNVNHEVEVVEMAKNTMWAQALSARVRDAFTQVRAVIQRSAGA